MKVEGEQSNISITPDLDSIFLSRLYFTKDVDSVYLESIPQNNLPFIDLPRENTLVLNFNYTKIADSYCKSRDLKCLHIHGNLEEPESIVLGYGDELDDDYQKIVKYNEFLRNIKSFRYLEDTVYKEINSFIGMINFKY